MSSPKVSILCQSPIGLNLLECLAAQYQQHIHQIVTTENRDAFLKRFPWACVHYHFYEERDEKDLAIELQRDRPDHLLLLWWHKILKPPLLNLALDKTINFHPSLLPHGRGKAGNFWAIVEETPFGVSAHLVDADIDAGPVVAQREIPYDWLDTGETLYHRAIDEIETLLLDVFLKLSTNQLIEQSPVSWSSSIHFQRELDGASRIDLEQLYTGREILNLLRARTFPPHPACWFEDDGRIYEARIRINEQTDVG